MISIHTPARGVTGALPFFVDLWGISIHTPARGVTYSAVSKASTRHFNPHSRKGSDLMVILNVLSAQ